MNKFLLSSLACLTFVSLGSDTARAQSQNAQEQALLQLARDTATIAGGARYCELDQDDIEEFIGKVDARLAYLARDNYQKVLARLEFKNVLTAASAKEPEKGCQALERIFSDALTQANDQ